MASRAGESRRHSAVSQDAVREGQAVYELEEANNNENALQKAAAKRFGEPSTGKTWSPALGAEGVYFLTTRATGSSGSYSGFTSCGGLSMIDMRFTPRQYG